MRQQLTAEDLSQLTPEQQDKLRAWWKPEEWDMCIYHDEVCPVFMIDENYEYRGKRGVYLWLDDVGSGNPPVLKDECLPILGIGQLIQLLESYDKCLNVTNVILGDEYGNKFTWEVKLRHLGKYIYKEELVDALWQVVKEIL